MKPLLLGLAAILLATTTQVKIYEPGNSMNISEKDHARNHRSRPRGNLKEVQNQYGTKSIAPVLMVIGKREEQT